MLSKHLVMMELLPAIHKDPFDRMLIAQAGSEGILLLTSGACIAEYQGARRTV